MTQQTGYICKRCGSPSPAGVGYASAIVVPQPVPESCACGYSRRASAPPQDDTTEDV